MRAVSLLLVASGLIAAGCGPGETADGGAEDAGRADVTSDVPRVLDAGIDAPPPAVRPVALEIVSPAHLEISGAAIAISTFPRFGRTVTVPFIQSSRELEVRVRVGPDGCPARLRATLVGRERYEASITPTCEGDEPIRIAAGPGEYVLEIVAFDAFDRAQPSPESVTRLERVGIGDVFLVLGESTAEGYGADLGDGRWEASPAYAFDRFDHVPPGATSMDGRTLALIGATQVTGAESGCGAPSSVGCPVFTPPSYFAGYAIELADRLEAELGYPVLIWNLAYGGHTTAALLRYPGRGLLHESASQQLAALAPNWALLYSGINDMVCRLRCGADTACSGLCGDPATNQRALIDWAIAAIGSPERVVVADVTYFAGDEFDTPQTVAAAVSARVATGARRGPPLAALFEHQRGLLAADGLHPSAAGYRAIARELVPYIIAPRPQRVPEILFAPSRTSSPATGVIAMTGLTPGAAVGYRLQDPLGTTTFTTDALPCGTAMTATADSLGLCSFLFEGVALTPGIYRGVVIDVSGGTDTAPLEIR